MTEMTKLIMALEILDIPHEVRPHAFNGSTQVFYPNFENRKMDVICFEHSYGGGEGLLEIMGLLTDEEAECDDVVGFLDAKNVVARILHDMGEV